MKLLLFILIFIFIFFYFFPWFFKKILPYLISRYIKKTTEKFREQNGYNEQPQQKEGEVKVDYIPPGVSKTKISPDSGDYVDFEEIENKE